jgi:hypothetical protein
MSRHEQPRDPQDRELTPAKLKPAELTPELAAVEQQLAALAPRAARVDRDRLMFLAGAASEQGPVTRPAAVQRLSWLWPSATGVLAATSLGLAVLLAVRETPAPQIVYVPAPAAAGGSIADASPAPTPREQPALAEAVPERQLASARPAASDRSAGGRGSIPRDNYLQVRDVALRMGLDALAVPRSSGGATPTEGSDVPTYRSLMQAAFGPVDESEPAGNAPREFSQM